MSMSAAALPCRMNFDFFCIPWKTVRRTQGRTRMQLLRGQTGRSSTVPLSGPRNRNSSKLDPTATILHEGITNPKPFIRVLFRSTVSSKLSISKTQNVLSKWHRTVSLDHYSLRSLANCGANQTYPSFASSLL